jgi:hypothetical protein
MTDQTADPLRAAQLAFERGDYAETRRLAQSILAGEATPDARTEAEDLLKRTGHDKVAIVLAIACLVFFLIVFLSYAGHH